jgi:hypothetical protein
MCPCDQVEMELQVGGVMLNVKVSPVLATLLLQFRQQEKLSAADLAGKVGGLP